MINNIEAVESSTNPTNPGDYLIDTHCHLHDPEWFTEEQQIDFLAQAKAENVQGVICIGTNHQDSFTARDFANEHREAYWTYGIHPEFANSETIAGLCAQIESFRESQLKVQSNSTENDSSSSIGKKRLDVKENAKLVAIGEIGLDYHYDGYDRASQIKLFEATSQLALDLDLPVSLHIREAFDDAFTVLENFPKIRGVVHSFTGSKKCLKKVLERDFYVGVNGLATYTTTPLPPLEKMLLETDAPFLTPTPFRGTMNQPKYIHTIATYLANELGVAEEIIVEQTTKNARKLFCLRESDA